MPLQRACVLPGVRCDEIAVSLCILTSLSLLHGQIMGSEYYHDILKLCLVMQQKKKINFTH
jgi:hypothetical protein